MCRVVAVPQENRYKLRCQYGLLSGLFPTGTLASVCEAISKGLGDDISLDTEGSEILLRQAAQLAATSNRASVACNCKKGYGTSLSLLQE
jgi:hypothetical protein